MDDKIPLPRGWNRRAKSAIIHILALSHYTFTVLVARAANDRNRRTRIRAEIDRLEHEIALLQEELRIKDARMARVPPHRRPHYAPPERMAILELRAARGWSSRQAADRFHVAATTLGSWKARIDEQGPNALLQIPIPVNKFPDLVCYIVRRLKLLCPRLGKVKIAEMLCRAGLHLAPTTVGRFLRADLRWPEPLAVTVVSGPVVKARRPNELWHIDLTAVPTGLGFWTSWCPHALPQEWPFCWWVAVVLDHYSRRVQGWMVLGNKPDARALCAFLSRVTRQVGTTPRYLLSDKESMFKSALALHDLPSAGRVLEQVATGGRYGESLRQDAIFWLGVAREEFGFEALRRMVSSERDPEIRWEIPFGLGESEVPEATDLLIRMARKDNSADVRREALFWMAQKAGDKVAGAISDAIENDPETEVKRAAVFARAEMPDRDGVPLLIKLIENHSNPVVRKEAMFWLAESDDPRALDSIENILNG